MCFFLSDCDCVLTKMSDLYVVSGNNDSGQNEEYKPSDENSTTDEDNLNDIGL